MSLAYVYSRLRRGCPDSRVGREHLRCLTFVTCQAPLYACQAAAWETLLRGITCFLSETLCPRTQAESPTPQAHVL